MPDFLMPPPKDEVSSPMPPNSEDIQIRYSRFGLGDASVPKNTLVTYRDGEQVYFGIARCNLQADHPSKLLGRSQARFRADHAVRRLGGVKCVFLINEGGLDGKCHQDTLHMLLDYFYGLDR